MSRRRGLRLVYTLGHSNRTIGEFMSLLKLYHIVHVVDVRRFPGSRRVPWFNKEVLRETLLSRGIGYTWLGDLLGGFRPGGYEAYMATEDYQRGINKLINIIESTSGPVAIMCRERYWRRCHRRFIANTLVYMGYQVVHIIDADKAELHPPQLSSGED
ncbi:DUF488 family protein [Pyrodictium delaneyi]|nr:DUF488 domain-containing protein [Pyrodictium delaneyi]